MMQKWHLWEPIEGKEFAEKYWIESVIEIEDEKTLEVILSDFPNETHAVRIHFNQPIEAYRNANERFRLKLFSTLREKYGSSFHGRWTFFKVTHSEYLEWFLNKSKHKDAAHTFIHFVFMGIESVLEVIATYEPTVELFLPCNNNQNHHKEST